MLWIVQNNLFSESSIRELFNYLETRNYPYHKVKVIPFGGGIEPDLQIDEPCVVIGSISLVKHAKKKGWSPGAWNDPKKYNYRNYIEAFGNEMLNSNGKISTLRYAPKTIVDLQLENEKFFIRPVEDSKAFAGEVMMIGNFIEWRDRLANADKGWSVGLDTEVVIAPVTEIYSEYRFICSGRSVLTGSLYSRGGRTYYSTVIDDRIKAYAKHMLDPFVVQGTREEFDDMFVMDIADTPSGPKIIEINNFNSAGWYACDVQKVVERVNSLMKIEQVNKSIREIREAKND